MKKMTLLVAAVFLIVIFLAVGIALPGTILPSFSSPPTCKQAAVVIYQGEYDREKKEVSLLIKNPGNTFLQLESFITRPDGVTEHSRVVYLSAGGEGTFTFEDVGSPPQEWTLQDITCGVADLWKF